MPTPDERLGHPPVDILWIFAHPDDETFGSAGTMAWAAERGLRTAYVCATRGEAGVIRDPEVATHEILGAVREQELRNAAAIVGVDELRLLGFRDSGMEGTPENDDPRALIRQPHDAIVAHLVGHVRDLRPATVVTFGPEGLYGHPDHILIGRLTERAVALAADPAYLPRLEQPWRVTALYHAVAPRSRMLALAADASQPLGSISERSRQNLGTPDEAITHRLDVTPWLSLKSEAIAAHRTQTAGRADLQSTEAAPPRPGLSIEHYMRQPLPWDPAMSAGDPLTRARAEIGAIPTPQEAAR